MLRVEIAPEALNASMKQRRLSAGLVNPYVVVQFWVTGQHLTKRAHLYSRTHRQVWFLNRDLVRVLLMGLGFSL